MSLPVFQSHLGSSSFQIPVACHKFASNVFEKALTYGEEEDKEDLVEELIDCEEDRGNKIKYLLHHQYGNFPIQTALTVSKGDRRLKVSSLQICLVPY